MTSLATKRRTLSEGVVVAEVDPEEKSGCLIEFRSRQPETLRAEEFRSFARDLCVHILEKAPRYVTRNDVPWESVRGEERAHRATAEKMFATSDSINDYLAEKMGAFFQGICLMEQPFVKDPSRLVGEAWETLQRKLEDPVEIRRFSHFTIDGKP